MNKLQYLLTKIAEESSEVAQIALKTQQFGVWELCPGLEDTNVQRIHKEFNDLLAVVEMFNEEVYNKLNGSKYGEVFRSEELIQQKKQKIEKYFQYSIDCGQVDEP
jgi:NTP pyrophosphatase (non-canonical NTP hydrolase)